MQQLDPRQAEPLIDDRVGGDGHTHSTSRELRKLALQESLGRPLDAYHEQVQGAPIHPLSPIARHQRVPVRTPRYRRSSALR